MLRTFLHAFGPSPGSLILLLGLLAFVGLTLFTPIAADEPQVNHREKSGSTKLPAFVAGVIALAFVLTAAVVMFVANEAAAPFEVGWMVLAAAIGSLLIVVGLVQTHLGTGRFRTSFGAAPSC